MAPPISHQIPPQNTLMGLPIENSDPNDATQTSRLSGTQPKRKLLSVTRHERKLIDYGAKPAAQFRDPRSPLQGIIGLSQIADREFYMANTFQVQPQIDEDRFREHTREHLLDPNPYPMELNDQPSRRPFLYNLEFLVESLDWFSRDDIGSEYIFVMRQLPILYPKLRSLTVRFQRCILTWDRGYKPLSGIVHERKAFLENIVRAVADVPGLKQKYVELKQYTTVKKVKKPAYRAVETDGRSREVTELCWEMLDLPYPTVRL